MDSIQSQTKMLLPNYIENKLEAILKQLIQYKRQFDLDISTGFLRIEAWIWLEEPLDKLTNLRLLIGSAPTILRSLSQRNNRVECDRRMFGCECECSFIMS